MSASPMVRTLLAWAANSGDRVWVVVRAWTKPSTRASSAGTTAASTWGAIDGAWVAATGAGGGGAVRVRALPSGGAKGLTTGSDIGFGAAAAAPVGLASVIDVSFGIPPDRREQIYPAARSHVHASSLGSRRPLARSADRAAAEPPDAAQVGRGDLARTAYQQGRGHRRGGGGGGVAVHPGEDAFGGDGADARRVLGHHGDARLEHVGEGDVVEADQRDGVLQLELVQRADGAEGDHVLAGEQRGGRGADGHQGPDRRLGRLLRAQVVDVQCSVRQVGPVHRVGEAASPIAGGGDGQLVAQVRDALVSRARSDAGWPPPRPRSCR